MIRARNMSTLTKGSNDEKGFKGIRNRDSVKVYTEVDNP